jgi:hypothetical protein
MFGFAPGVQATPNSVPLWSSKASFVGVEDNPNPIVDKWTSKIYWTSINEKFLALENVYQLYCIDGMKALVNGQAQNCDGYGNGIQDGLSLPDLWPYAPGAALPGTYAIQWIYAPSVVPNVALNGVDRFLFAITLQELLQEAAPIGCLFTASTTRAWRGPLRFPPLVRGV